MSDLYAAYQRLLEHFGHQHWWPGDGPVETIVGAVLVQNTNWNNVERALERLREDGALSISALDAMSMEELAELIRPAGTYQVKARRLKNLLRLIVDEYGGSIEAMREADSETLREQLLRVNGIGRETADCILLYACGKPRFVVDTYTHRVLARHGWVDFDADYDTIQQFMESSLEPDVPMYNEYHALLVSVGKTHCRKTPICESCPLAPMLPPRGPYEPDFL